MEVAFKPLSSKPPSYRADLAGLRGLAILGVLFFHLDGLVPLPGGFVGVDVFFVLSGYLVSTLLLKSLENGQFTFKDFYFRRIRRLAPALLVSLGATALVGYFINTPEEFLRIGKALVANLFGLSNLYFSRLDSYFSPLGGNPLRHTWSLAVEEQFYLFLPPALILLHRHRRVFEGTLLLAILSLLTTNIFSLRFNQEFYWLPPRAWEFLVGTLLATKKIPSVKNLWLREALGLVGIGLIIFSYLSVGVPNQFLLSRTGMPVLGTVLVLYGQSTLLAWKPMQWLGEISYSLYLWHWPILVTSYTLKLRGIAVSPYLQLGLILITSWLSWRFVEQPIRGGTALSSNFSLMKYLGGAWASITLLAGITVTSEGLPNRFSRAERELAGLSVRPHPSAVQVWPQTSKTAEDRPTFLIWGDSHAYGFTPALQDANGSTPRSGRLVMHFGCPPLLGVSRRDKDCPSGQREAMGVLEKYSSIRTVILIARWGVYAESTNQNNVPGPITEFSDDTPQAFTGNNHQVYARGLIRTLKTLQEMGKQVLIVGPVPEQSLDVPNAIMFQNRWGLQTATGLTQLEFLERQKHVLQLFETLKPKFGFEIVYPHQTLCQTGSCQFSAEGRPLYTDDNHLVPEAWKADITLLQAILKKM